MTPRFLLTFNAGSSSTKLGVHALSPAGRPAPCAQGGLEASGRRTSAHLELQPGWTLPPSTPLTAAWTGAPLPKLIGWIESTLGGSVVAVGHRMVHGGRLFAGPARITSTTLRQLQALSVLAPLHQPIDLAPIEALRAARPDLPQAVAFDTSFHHGLPPLQTTYGIPRALTRRGLRRYGFHGLSYEYLAGELRRCDPAAWRGRTVIAHLGSGASLCAVQRGKSLATTMGFSVLDGLVMGTRPGNLDAGVLLHLLKVEKQSPAQLEQLLYHQCGLKGVSDGISSDWQALRASRLPAAKEAIALFTQRVVEGIATMAAAAGGLDAVVFSGGIGAKDAVLRQEIADGCRWLGLQISPAANRGQRPRLHRPGSPVSAWLIPTDEELMIARHCASVLF